MTTTVGWKNNSGQVGETPNIMNTTRQNYGKLKDIYVHNTNAGVNINSHRGSSNDRR